MELFNSKNVIQLCAAHGLVCDTSAAVLGLVNILEKDKNAHFFHKASTRNRMPYRCAGFITFDMIPLRLVWLSRYRTGALIG